MHNPEREAVYRRDRDVFLRTIALEYQNWKKILTILNTPNPRPERYHEIGWKSGQLAIAKAEFAGTLLISSCDVHDILPWTQSEIDALDTALAHYRHA